MLKCNLIELVLVVLISVGLRSEKVIDKGKLVLKNAEDCVWLTDNEINLY
ncbi:11282_t:CDS:2 [Racocetra fulgida]|uniref:11282_t:CDS:1 n=1 Tax=Racocetra fulgida TaxID=60492 RepID=A0A9N8W5S4_9GLOM|nr:11282_t:CDS:2 [Racocetra fulgida]